MISASPEYQPDKWLGVLDASDMLGISRATFYRLLPETDFPKAIKIGSRAVWSRRELETWMMRYSAKSSNRFNGG